MGSPLAIDWQDMQVLALAIGLREAIRQKGLEKHENAIMQRSAREDWFGKRHEAQALLNGDPAAKARLIAAAGGGVSSVSARVSKRPEQAVSSVSTIPTAAEILVNLGHDSKSKGALALNNGLSHFAEMPAEQLVERADKFKALVSTGTTLHGWADPKAGQSTSISFTFHAGMQPPELAQVVDVEALPVSTSPIEE